MSGRKKRNNKQRGQSAELLNELHSIRDLLGSNEVGDIPLLDQVAEPAPKPPRPAPVRQPLQEPLDESDLPILFSPVDEELPEDDYPAELGEAERELLRPLQDLPKKTEVDKPQGELFAQPATPGENPFLPAHIRARLTGGRMPNAEPEPHVEIREPEPPKAPGEPASEAPAPAEDAASASREERERQRQQLIDHLVAKQLPELERQLRERIARMVDELEAKR